MFLMDPPVNPFDWTPVWSLGQSLLVGIVAVVGTVLGVVVTDRRAARRAEAERRAARRAEVRAVVTDLIESGLEFGYQGETYTLSYATPPGVPAIPLEEKEVKHAEFRATRLRHMRAITSFLLTVQDAEPAAKGQALADRMEEMQKFTGPIISAGIEGRPTNGPQVMAMLGYFEHYLADVIDLRATLSAVTAEPLADAEES